MTVRNLRNRGAYDRSHVDWTFANNHLPRNIKIGDADGIVEINFRLLLLEHKLSNAEHGVDRAHRLMYQHMAMRGDTVIVFWSDPPHETIDYCMVWDAHEGAVDKPWRLENIPQWFLCALIEEWGERADAAEMLALAWTAEGDL